MMSTTLRIILLVDGAIRPASIPHTSELVEFPFERCALHTF